MNLNENYMYYSFYNHAQQVVLVCLACFLLCSLIPVDCQGIHSDVVVPVSDSNIEVQCKPPQDVENLYWNGIDHNGQPISTLSYNFSGGYAILSIPAIARYNLSIFTCFADLETTYIDNEVKTIRFVFQGRLEPVTNLTISGSNTSIHISWTAPFSLNLTTAEPDIQYCVDVYNITGGGDLVESRCDITETFYTYTPDNPSPDHVFNFTVTPRSNGEGALNGTTSEPVQGYVIDTPLPIPSDNVIFQTDSELDPIKFHFPVSVIGTSPGRQPTDYTVRLRYVDFGPESPCSCPTSHTTIDNTVTLTLLCDSSTCHIDRHRICDVEIIASNCAGNSSSERMEISTHDIQDVKSVSTTPGQIDISCSYLTGSSDKGFFTIVYSPSNHSVIMYCIAPRDGMEPNTNLSLNGLQNNDYVVTAYDLNTGIPEERPAASARSIIINITENMDAGTVEPQTLLPWLPEVTSSVDGKIYVNCSFSERAITGCVGIIHSADLTNKINKPLTFVVVRRTDFSSTISHNNNFTILEYGDYNVAVFGQLDDILESAPAYVTTVTVGATASPPPASVSNGIIIACAVIVVIIVIVIVVFVIVMKRRSKKRLHSITQLNRRPPVSLKGTSSLPVTVEDNELHVLDSNYETIELSDRPPAYETVDLPTKQQTSIPIDDDAPPLPPPCKPEDIIGHSQVELTLHGAESVSTMTAVEEQQAQPESDGIHIEGYIVPEPAYDVAKIVMVKQAASSGPLVDSTATEHQYSEIGGAINIEGLHYAHVTPKPKPEGLPDQPVDPTAVIYSQVVKDKVVPEDKDSKKVPQTKPVPPPPTAESLLSIIHPISDKWEEFGKALGIDEDRLDGFSSEGHDKVRLHDMVHHYFGNVHVKHTWEKFVVALKKIGEYEYADKIVREKKLEDVYFNPDSAPVPPVPPRGCASTQTAEPDFEILSIVVGPKNTHVRNGSVGETSATNNTSFIPRNMGHDSERDPTELADLDFVLKNQVKQKDTVCAVSVIIDGVCSYSP